jgi:glutamate-ammonia-ligase adenylyltransferase
MDAPEAVTMLGSEAELDPRPVAALLSEARAMVSRYPGEAEKGVGAARGLRRRELFRTAIADLSGHIGIEEVGQALSALNDVTIQAALDAAVGKVEMERRAPLGTRFAVIAMGRLGGIESSYGSDADVMFVHSPLEGMPEREASYAAYYERWSSPWESQALLRARFSAGDAELGVALLHLADPLRYPADGISDAAVLQIRKLKARMEAERLPRGADPALHTKLGPGGLSDVEWVAQLIQLRHAGRLPSLRTTRTLETLRAAVVEELLSEADEDVLSQAWTFASRIRDAIVLVRGRAADSIPVDVRERALISRVLGYPPDGSEDFVDDYRRATRRARRVVERVFYEG